MARALSSRRGKKAADAWAEPPDDNEREVLTNTKARHDTIVMAVRELARMEAEAKAINAEIREFKQVHIKGDLGFKLADWNAVYRVSQLEVEDRDQLLDTLREGFQALGVGGSLDWVAAATGEPQPEPAAPAPKRARGRRQAAEPASPHDEARRVGREDALAGHRDHAARWPAGEYGHADYALGHDEGEAERGRVMALGNGNGADPEPAAAPAAPRRARGRPRKTPEPDLIEGAGATTH